MNGVKVAEHPAWSLRVTLVAACSASVICLAAALARRRRVTSTTHARAESNRELPKRVVPFQPFTIGQGHVLYSDDFFHTSTPWQTLTSRLLSANKLRQAGAAQPSGRCPSLQAVDGIDPKAVWWARNILTAEECASVIATAHEHGFHQRKFEGEGKDSSSSVVWCPEFAGMIFNRLLDAQRTDHATMPQISYYDASPGLALSDLHMDWQTVTHWGKLVGCNPSIRVEHYEPMQQLKIHRDGAVRVRHDYKTTHPTNLKFGDTYTVHAVLIYLNDEYTGGSTSFVADRDSTGQYVFKDLRGGVGDALLFRHELLHRGSEVKAGTKYILRLDLAFRHVIHDSAPHDGTPPHRQASG